MSSVTSSSLTLHSTQPGADHERSARAVAQESGASSPVYAGESQKLKKACEELEAVFLSILWQHMAKEGGINLGGWDVLANQAIGEKWAQCGGIGLAKVIYDSVSKSSLKTSLGDDLVDRRKVQN